MSKIGLEIGTEPDKSVRPRVRSIRPQVRPPGKPRRYDSSSVWIKVQVRGAVDLVLDHPTHRERRFIRERLRIEGAWVIGVGASAAGIICDFDVRIIRLQIAGDSLQIALEDLRVQRKRA